MGLKIYASQTGAEQIVNGEREWYPCRCDSSGGVDYRLEYYNDSDDKNKALKYIIVNVVPMNAVGDMVACSVSGEVEKSLKITGPIGKGSAFNCKRAVWENVWYNSSIQTAKITSIEVQYMDGTEEKYDGDNLPRHEGGCYVATAVYGSYNCPEVWTLRRYRDFGLATTWYGRAFIRTYYAVSPTIVKLFGDNDWFNKMWKGKLDRMVKNLKAEGYKDTPYDDLDR